MGGSSTLEFVEKTINEQKCSAETKEFLIKALQMEHLSRKGEVNSNDYFRIMSDILKKRRD